MLFIATIRPAYAGHWQYTGPTWNYGTTLSGTGIEGAGGVSQNGATIEDLIVMQAGPSTDLNLSTTFFTYTFSFSWVPDNSTDYPPKSVNAKVIDTCEIRADSGGEISGIPAPFEVSLSCGLAPADCATYYVWLTSYPSSTSPYTVDYDLQYAIEYLTLGTNIPLGLGSEPTTEGYLSYTVPIDGEVTGATSYYAVFDVQFYFE
jgi:hypothetical protein